MSKIPVISQDVVDGYKDGRAGIGKRKPLNPDYLHGWNIGLEDAGGHVVRDEPLALLKVASS